MRELLVQLDTLLLQFSTIDLGYPLGDNRIIKFDGTTTDARSAFVASLGLSDELTEFYQHCDGLSLPDVRNGYFIRSLTQFSNPRPDDPGTVFGASGGEVLIFGTDGGGAYFAIRPSDRVVLYLPPATIEDGIYYPTRLGISVLAITFSDFLNRLLSDVRAFAEGDVSHKYMC